MGGSGSGRRCTDEFLRLDVRWLQRQGLLAPGLAFSLEWTPGGERAASVQGQAEGDRVILTYRHQQGGEEWKEESYPVRLDWTPCTYGGARVWFRCPAVGCGRRVAILYGGPILACRHCYPLVYRSQREEPYERLTRRAKKIRVRLGWERSMLNAAGGKPKGMRWHTFERLVARHDALAEEAWRRVGLL